MTLKEEFYTQKVHELSTLRNEALIDTFNAEVGNTAWSNPRGVFLSALNDEISKRNFKDDRLIIKNGRLSIKKRVKLIDNQLSTL
ncbi:hypothetical protein [Flammeovirga sp. EKP202]|uniref:hypothetical protein n=1 Tax=Flammeovirga sp. EKP202 TaxID=2770592 RepID=UPI00165FB44D|nr:hypothetical protein [Flammeovirga sp. EKP202]MBD0401398.1 hypothetical protein [Flammeovirga sp. EKP202]